MPDEVKKEGTQATGVTTTDTTDWKAKYETALIEQSKLTETISTLEAKATKYETAVKKNYESNLFANILDMDLAKLAPAIELGADGEISTASLTAINKWKTDKAHFFKLPEKTASADEKATENKAIDGAKVPPTNNSEKRGVEYFDKLRVENPTEWRKPAVQQAYIRALQAAQQTK